MYNVGEYSNIGIDLNKDVTGFEYTNLTCAFDTLLTSFLVIYQSESLEKKAVFERSMPFLTSTFERVLNESMTYPDAKEHLLLTYFFSEGRFRPNQFQMVGDVIEFILRSQILSVEERDENFIQLQYYQKLTCHSEMCSSRDPSVTPDFTNSIAFHGALVDKSSINSMINEYFVNRRRHFKCLMCSIFMKEEWIITKLPRVLYVALCGDEIEFDIDRQIILDNVVYKLIVVIYSGSGHFMSRMMVNDKVVEYDGMVANGYFRSVDPVNAFHTKIVDLSGTQRMAFQILYKREGDSY